MYPCICGAGLEEHAYLPQHDGGCRRTGCLEYVPAPAAPPPPPRGVYIELEGPDGCGKSTQARLLVDGLTAAGHRTWLAAQPTADTRIGKLIRDMLAGREAVRDRRTLPLLFAADRMEYSCEIRDLVSRGAIVIGDRGALSTWAYATAAARAAEDAHAEAVSRWSDALSDFAFQPALVLVLTLPAEECARRLAKRGGKRDLLEADALRQHVIDCYDEALDSRLGRVVQRINAGGSVEEVHERVLATVLAAIAAARG